MARFAVSSMAFTAAVLVCMLVVASHVDASLTCAEVTNLLTPCISYAIFGGTVLQLVVKGIKALNAASNTTQDHRAACSCIMDGLSKIPGINYELVGTLPQTCGTTCSYKITPTTDCSKVD
ncbi:non-specific lipid-transfer protein 1-like [Quercus suber]|uniref:non-specific lipid-transfer protein 1-like n=1 Tax=Quercus suber TaxID=58331 RepID=UPI000F1A21B3